MSNFIKGIFVGIGGIAPGLSGSILLVIFGLYQKMIEAMGTFFKNVKKNILFLMPLFLGFGVGVLIFGKIVDFLITEYEMYTRFAFLGLILGTIPLFYKEVTQQGFSNKYYVVAAISCVLGALLFMFNKRMGGNLENPNFAQSILLGVAIAGSTIVPGVDSAAILSALGLYEVYLSSIADFNLSILLPAGIGLALGALAISFMINKLIEKHYTATFSVIFGLFLATIPNILTANCQLGLNKESIISILIAVAGFGVSYFLGKVKEDQELLDKIVKYTKKLSAKKEKVKQ